MSDGETTQGTPVLYGEVLETDEAYLRAVYEHSGVEAVIARYVDTHSNEDSAAADLALARFCDVVAATAFKGEDEIDVDVVHAAFDLVTDSMNEVASRKYGYSRQGALRAMLVRAGARPPETTSFVRRLDDNYWSSQFMDQYKNGGLPMAPRQEDETGQGYFARYTYTCMHGFLFAYFTVTC